MRLSLWVGMVLLLGACADPVLDTGLIPAPVSSPLAAPVPTPVMVGTAALSGVVSGPGGQPLLAGIRLRINGQSVLSDSTGFYRFSGLEPGEVKLIAEGSGYQPVALTVRLQSGQQVQDLALVAVRGAEPTAAPSASAGSPQPIFLPPSDLPASPVPTATALPVISPTPVATLAPTPQPTATPLYDPALDQAAVVNLFLKRKTTGLELNFLFARLNGLPVEWQWGTVQAEYYLAVPLKQAGTVSGGELITSGRTGLSGSNQPFVLPLDSVQSRLLGETVFATCTLTFPDQRVLTFQKEISVTP